MHTAQSITTDFTTAPTMKATPQKGMVDEPVRIEITNLKPLQKITIATQIKEGLAKRIAYGHFVSDTTGYIDMYRDASLGGTYTGNDVMGLFWSMEAAKDQDPPHCRLMKKDVKTPFTVHVTVIEGFVSLTTWNELVSHKILCRSVIERWYLSGDTIQETIRHGRIRGTLFYPKHGAKHPGVIDLFGGAGGLIDVRAALLASHGFTTLALPYFDFDDLPKDLNFDYGYFDEAIQFMLNHTKVDKENGLTVIGVSKGGEIAAHMASYNPEIRNCVVINGTPFYYPNDILYKGDLIRAHSNYYDQVKFENDLVILDDAILQGLYKPEVDQIPVHRSQANFLILQSGADLATKPILGETLAQRVKQGGNASSCQLFMYPGAGHLLEPPYLPLSRCVFLKSQNIYMDYGGDMYLHAKAQEHAWGQILKLLREQYNIQPPARTLSKTTVNSSKL